MKFKELWDLQLFADEGDGTDATPPDPEGGEGKPDGKPAEPTKKYTDEDVDKIVAKKLAKWTEKANAEKAEAEKLAKMNADEKTKYELEQLRKENEELKSARDRAELTRSAAAIMKESGLEATADALALVVGSDAETTKANIDKLNTYVQSALKKAEAERATGRTPKNYGAAGKGKELSPFEKRIAKYKK